MRPTYDHTSTTPCAYCPNLLSMHGAEAAVGICADCWKQCPSEGCYGERRHEGVCGINASNSAPTPTVIALRADLATLRAEHAALTHDALRFVEERDKARDDLAAMTAERDAVHQAAYDAGVQARKNAADAMAARRDVAKLREALREAARCVSGGGVASIGGDRNTYTPQVPRAYVEKWAALLARTDTEGEDA